MSKTKTTETETVVAPAAESALRALKFKTKKKLSQNQLKLAVGKPIYIAISSAMYKGKKIDDKKDPATLVDAIDLETGENCLVVVPTVVESTLNEEYPDEGYVGKEFMIEKLEKSNPDKRYFPYLVSEIEVG